MNPGNPVLLCVQTDLRKIRTPDMGQEEVTSCNSRSVTKGYVCIYRLDLD